MTEPPAEGPTEGASGVNVGVVPAEAVDVVETNTGKLPLSWYISSLFGPPQYSLTLSSHFIEQSLTEISALGWFTEPFSITLP